MRMDVRLVKVLVRNRAQALDALMKANPQMVCCTLLKELELF